MKTYSIITKGQDAPTIVDDTNGEIEALYINSKDPSNSMDFVKGMVRGERWKFASNVCDIVSATEVTD